MWIARNRVLSRRQACGSFNVGRKELFEGGCKLDKRPLKEVPVRAVFVYCTVRLISYSSLISICVT